MIEAIRDNEEAVKALGKNPARFKIQVLMLGAALAGVAGGFYAHYIGYIVPEQFIPLITFYVWMAIIIGGVGRISGAVAGTLILMTFLEGSRFLRGTIPFVSEVEMASVRIGVIGLALVLFTLYRPQGLMGVIRSNETCNRRSNKGLRRFAGGRQRIFYRGHGGDRRVDRP